MSAPHILLPYQTRWVRDRSGVKLYTKSRRIGISWAEAGDCALVASQTSGEDAYYIGYEKEMTRGFIEDCADWARAYNLAVSEIEESEEVFRDGDDYQSIQVFRLYFNSGWKIEALSSRPRSLRSRQGRVVLDEAAFHDDLKELLKAAKALRIWGSRIHVISTYNGVENDYYELEQDVLAGRLPYSRHHTTFDDAIAEGLFRRICLKQEIPWTPEAEAEFVTTTYEEFGDDADEELRCIPSKSGGAYFSHALLEKISRPNIPVLRLKLTDGFLERPQMQREREIDEWLYQNFRTLLSQLNPNLRTFFGWDFGRVSDLSYLFVTQEQPNLVKLPVLALELQNIPFKQQEQILFWLCDRLPRLSYGAMDSRGNGAYLAEVTAERYGRHRIEGVALSNPFYAEHFPKYRAALEDERFLLPADADLMADHRQVHLDKGIPKVADRKTRGTDGKSRHGDGAIACLLCCYASSREPVVARHAIATEAWGNW